MWPCLLSLLACDPPAPERPLGPSVVLVTLGGVGADRLAAHPLPALDRLAAQGVAFDRAYAASPDEPVALAALHTGAPPPVTGVRGPAQPLPGAHPTVAEVLADAGWATAAAGRAPDDLQRGFALVDDTPGPDGVRGLPPVPGPSFLWVHLSDAASPCTGPEVDLADRCAGALARVDARLDALVRRLPPTPDRWFVVAGTGGQVVADGGVVPGFELDDARLRVPLVIAGGDWRPHRDPSPVGLVDLGATLHALARPPDAPTPSLTLWSATDLRQGRPTGVWHEALAGARWLDLRPLYGWTFAEGRYVEGAWAATYPLVADGLVVATHPTHRTPRGPSSRPEAAALARRRTVDQQAPVRWTAAAGDHGDPLPGPGTGDPRDATHAAAQIARLRGWIRTGLLGPAERELGRLSALRRQTWAVEWLAADLAAARGDPEGVLDRLARLHTRTDSPAVALRAGELLLRQDRAALALDRAHDAIRVAPDAPAARALAARAEVRQGALARADVHLAELQSRRPVPDALWGERAWADGLRRVSADAADAALGSDPFDPAARVLRARVLHDAGDLDGAAHALEFALSAELYDVRTRRLLATVELERGEPAAAIRLLGPFRDGADPVAEAVWAAATAAIEDARGPQVPKRPWR